MNQTTIAGHLGADPEVRFTSSGKKITTLRVATRVRRGGNKDDTIWWRVFLWGEEFDKILTFFKKGSAIIVVGDLNKPEIFTDKEGKPQISMSMTGFHIMFSPFGGGGKPEPQEPYAYVASSQQQQPAPQPESYGMNEAPAYGQNKMAAPIGANAFSDDEIPF
jgi:single-strand DNA-binding protein